MKGIFKMKKNLILVIAIIIFSIALIGCGHTHEFEPATCTTPKMCSGCGETEGEALGHEWIEATCKEAKHCTLCGLIQGEPIEHSWSDATCTEAKTCSGCKLTDGEPLGHVISDWSVTKETSCAEEGERAGVCERCSKECKESIEKLPHTQSDWQVKKDYIFEPDGTVKSGTEVIVCTACKEEIKTREYTVEITLSQKNAVICAYDEISYWHCGPSFLINFCLVEGKNYPVSDAKLAVAHMDIDWDEQAILFAQQHISGSSKSGLSELMKYYGFNKEQIKKALAEVGY